MTNCMNPTITVAYFGGIVLPAASKMLTVLYTIALIPENCWKNIKPMDIPNGFKMLLLSKSRGFIFCCSLLFLFWFSLMRSNSESIFVLLVLGLKKYEEWIVWCLEINIYCPRSRWRDFLAASSCPCASNQIGVSGINIIPTKGIRGKDASTQAIMCHSWKAPIMYV